jgi:hypothetical protein
MTYSRTDAAAGHRRWFLALSLPFTLLFWVPFAGLIALVTAALGTPYVRVRGVQASGGWSVMWLGGLIFGSIGVLFTGFVIVTLLLGKWYLY